MVAASTAVALPASEIIMPDDIAAIGSTGSIHSRAIGSTTIIHSSIGLTGVSVESPGVGSPRSSSVADCSVAAEAWLLAASSSRESVQSQSPSSAASSSGKIIPASLQKRISKTKICIHNLSGRCSRASKCSFAHSMQELKEPPDLYKTRLCISWTTTGICPKGNGCRFAHGGAELRSTPEFFKTSLCPHWHPQTNSGCAAGERCRWAHGVQELRQRGVTVAEASKTAAIAKASCPLASCKPQASLPSPTSPRLLPEQPRRRATTALGDNAPGSDIGGYSTTSTIIINKEESITAQRGAITIPPPPPPPPARSGAPPPPPPPNDWPPPPSNRAPRDYSSQLLANQLLSNQLLSNQLLRQQPLEPPHPPFSAAEFLQLERQRLLEEARRLEREKEQLQREKALNQELRRTLEARGQMILNTTTSTNTSAERLLLPTPPAPPPPPPATAPRRAPMMLPVQDDIWLSDPPLNAARSPTALGGCGGRLDSSPSLLTSGSSPSSGDWAIHSPGFPAMDLMGILRMPSVASAPNNGTINAAIPASAMTTPAMLGGSDATPLPANAMNATRCLLLLEHQQQDAGVIYQQAVGQQYGDDGHQQRMHYYFDGQRFLSDEGGGCKAGLLPWAGEADGSANPTNNPAALSQQELVSSLLEDLASSDENDASLDMLKSFASNISFERLDHLLAREHLPDDDDDEERAHYYHHNYVDDGTHGRDFSSNGKHASEGKHSFVDQAVHDVAVGFADPTQKEEATYWVNLTKAGNLLPGSKPSSEDIGSPSTVATLMALGGPEQQDGLVANMCGGYSPGGWEALQHEQIISSGAAGGITEKTRGVAEARSAGPPAACQSLKRTSEQLTNVASSFET